MRFDSNAHGPGRKTCSSRRRDMAAMYFNQWSRRARSPSRTLPISQSALARRTRNSVGADIEYRSSSATKLSHTIQFVPAIIPGAEDHLWCRALHNLFGQLRRDFLKDPLGSDLTGAWTSGANPTETQRAGTRIALARVAYSPGQSGQDRHRAAPNFYGVMPSASTFRRPIRIAQSTH